MNELPLHLGVVSDTGQLREANEDAVGHVQLDDGLLVVVADGMGGHQAGDVAARITVEAVVGHVQATVGDDPRERLYIGIERAHTAVRAQALQAGTLDMGCTVVAVFVQQGKAFVGHVGDSRLYLIRDGRVTWMTRDHTRVRFLVDAGLLDPSDAEGHPEGNVITRAVGHDPADVSGGFVVDVRNEPLYLMTGDSLLLCSDGLTDMVGDLEILGLLGGRGAEDASRALVERANACDKSGETPGGYDNVTVAVINVGSDRGAVASILDEDTVEHGTDSLGATQPDYALPQFAADEGYRPAYSTLVPDPTLDGVTATLPEEDEGPDWPGPQEIRGELTMPRRQAEELRDAIAAVDAVRTGAEDLEGEGNTDPVAPQCVHGGSASEAAAEAVPEAVESGVLGEQNESAPVEGSLPVARIALGLAVILAVVSALVLYFGGGAG